MKSLITIFLFIFIGCKPNSKSSERVSDVKSGSVGYISFEPVHKSANNNSLVSFKKGSHSFIDVRGVGDSGWANKGSKVPPTDSGFKKGLIDFDPNKELLSGHLNFINWETTVSDRCEKFFNVGYPFVGSKKSVSEAISWGYNLFSLSNNHSEDCENDGNARNGALSTMDIFSNLEDRHSIMSSGLGVGAELEKVVEKVFKVNGKSVKVAFASVSFLSWWTEYTSRYEYHGTKILKSFKESDADVKIISLHTQGQFEQAVKYGQQFIEEAGGDIVYQHGPHTWAGVKVYNKESGGKGVAFHGLGNFLHNQLGHNPENLIGRVLLDKRTFRPKQIQVIPVENWVGGKDVIINRQFKLPPANFKWKREKFNSHIPIPIGYFNL